MEFAQVLVTNKPLLVCVIYKNYYYDKLHKTIYTTQLLFMNRRIYE